MNRGKRVKGHLYFIHDFKRCSDGNYRYVGTDDGTLFSVSYGRTKLYASELPEWFVYGRYYKRFGYISTKGIKALKYKPNWHTNHFLKDDRLMVSYDKTESELGDDWDHTTWVWGSEILDVIKGAQIYSNFDITLIICQIKEKIKWLRKAHPDEYSEEQWHFDLDEWMQEPFKNGLPPKELKEILEKAGALTSYRITDIKEKYAMLRWYDNGVPVQAEKEYLAWQSKFVNLSKRTCIKCGAKATKMSVGYILPYCCECASNMPFVNFEILKIK